MSSFFQNIMSDITHDFRKNRDKNYLFGIIFAICILIGICLALHESANPYYKTGLFTGVVIGLREGYGYFIMLVLWNALTFITLFLATGNYNLLRFWPLLLGLRLVVKISDIVCALKFFFFSCCFAAILTLIIELLIVVLFYCIYLDLFTKSVNIFFNGDRTLIKEVALPVAIAVIALTVLQSVISATLLF